jgi:cell fate (sporulation/competence/biofilm development) regulator YlbF (YheA/YmcA/DUF963 family)
MDNQYQELHKLLVENKRIKDDEEARKLLEHYIRNCESDASSPFDKVFEICVEYFRPSDIEINKLPRRTQKEFIVFLLDNPGDEDAIRKKLQEILAGLGEDKVKTEKKLDTANNVFEEFKSNYNKFEKDNSVGVEIKFDETRDIEEYFETVPGNPTPQVRYRLKYRIADEFLGAPIERSTDLGDQPIIPHWIDIGIKNHYVTREREGMLLDYGKELKKDVKATEHELNSIDNAENTHKGFLENHDNMKDNVKSVDDDKKGETINRMRQELRELSRTSEFTRTS